MVDGRLRLAVAIAAIGVLAAAARAAPDGPEGSEGSEGSDTAAELDKLLADVVTAEGLVDYPRLMGIERLRRLDEVREVYERGPVPEDRAARLAFLINAYNVQVLSQALSQYRRPDFRSVADVTGFFDQRTVTVAGRSITLNDLENTKIRPMGDPRIHAALVCAARSCPPLRREAYRAEKLDAQLDDQCRRWINDPAKNRADGKVLRLSRVFEWYGADFEGPPYDGVTGFVRRYAGGDGAIAALLARDPEPEIEWLEYDWSLNLGVAEQPAAP